MKHLSILSACALFALASIVSAQEYTSVEDLKKNEVDYRDFQAQGEYLFVAGAKQFAVQVIADGKGKFTLVGYPGGFPGLGWLLEKRVRIIYKGEVNETGDKVLFKVAYMENGEDYRKQLPIPEAQATATAELDIAQKTVTFYNPGVPARVANAVEITSPTLGMKAPEGATLFYDGTSKDATNTDLIANFRKINEETGAMFSEFCTKNLEAGKPYYLHVEFMLSFMPNAKGQGRSNSGVYLNECYECQVLDSFGLHGENNECGGFYQQQRPFVNTCISPLKWQTYDFIVFPPKFDESGKKVENARVHVALNGVLIHDNLELKGHTPGRKGESPEPRGIYFQGHGNNVQYRNIWVKYDPEMQ
ncbi:MAG: DUF1080 domain-containing protein [Planctomycetia bacterium]|nr:DUF1080 domain-containing protein [Planctomycetia bacterium]